jgi:hypothetical protein
VNEPCGSMGDPSRHYGRIVAGRTSRERRVAEARRLGGLRPRREKTVSGAYDFEGLGSVDAIRRILEIATIDVLGLENSVVRARVLISAAQAATKLLETGELEARIASLEAATGLGRTSGDLFDDEAA